MTETYAETFEFDFFGSLIKGYYEVNYVLERGQPARHDAYGALVEPEIQDDIRVIAGRLYLFDQVIDITNSIGEYERERILEQVR